jgi:hypothetical protein
VTVNLQGHVFNGAGEAVNGATVNIFLVSTAADESTASADATASTTSDSTGLWTSSGIAEGLYDVRIKSGTEVRWLRYEDRIQVDTIEAANFRIRNPADTFEYDIVPAAIVADRTLTLPLITGSDTLPAIGLAQTWSAIQTFSANASFSANADIAFTGTTGTNDIVLTNALADALSVTDGSADILVIDTSTAGNVMTFTSAVTVGVNDEGHDVKFFGATSGQYLLWDESADELVLTGDTKLSFHDAAGGENIIASANGHLEINAGTTLDITAPAIDLNSSTEFNIDTAAYDLNASGAVTVDSAGISLDSSAASNLTTSGGALTITSAAAATWSTAAGILTVNGTGGVAIQEGGATIISISDARVLATSNTASVDLDASGAIQVNSSGGAISIANDNIDQTVNLATAGTRTLNIGIGDGTDITTTVIKGTVSVGVDDTGYDVKLFGASAGSYMEWDESVDTLRLVGPSADAAGSSGKLLLATAQTDVGANDVLGRIDFQAPLEAQDTDAREVAASITAVAQASFTASVNATDLIFSLGHSEVAAEKFRMTSQGEIGIGGANYGSDGQILTSGGDGVAVAWEAAPTGGKGAIWMQPHAVTGTGTLSENVGTYSSSRIGSASADGIAWFTVPIPSDFDTLTKAVIFCTSQGVNGDLRHSTSTQFSNDGEAYSASTDSISSAEKTLVSDQTDAVDISAAFTGIAANDIVGVKFTREGSNAADTIVTFAVFGLLMEYTI